MGTHAYLGPMSQNPVEMCDPETWSQHVFCHHEKVEKKMTFNVLGPNYVLHIW